MMARHSLGLTGEADSVERAVEEVLVQDYRTADIVAPNARSVTTSEMGDRIASAL